MDMRRKHQKPKPDRFMVSFTCTVTHTGWIFFDALPGTALRQAKKLLMSFPAKAVEDAALNHVSKIVVGRAIRESTVKKTLNASIPSPFTTAPEV